MSSSRKLFDHRREDGCSHLLGAIDENDPLIAKYERAKRDTAVGQRAILNDRVYVANSKRVPGELGLFSKTKFETGDPIITYRGIVYDLDTERGKRFAAKHDPKVAYYSFRLNDYDTKREIPLDRVRYIIDGSDPNTSSLARYVNAAIYEDEYNVCFLQFRKDMYLRARRHINPDEELLTSYGPDTYTIIGRPDLDPLQAPMKKKRRKAIISSSSSSPEEKRMTPVGKRRRQTARKVVVPSNLPKQTTPDTRQSGLSNSDSLHKLERNRPPPVIVKNSRADPPKPKPVAKRRLMPPPESLQSKLERYCTWLELNKDRSLVDKVQRLREELNLWDE